jgi:hypothetical protein
MSLGVIACAGRAPAPVAVVQPQDAYTDCAAIMAETAANNQKVEELASEQGLKVAQNVAAGVAGIVIPILWFGMDWQGSASKEVQALQVRQQYFATLAAQRCNAPAQRFAQPPRPRGSNWRYLDAGPSRHLNQPALDTGVSWRRASTSWLRSRRQ